MKLVDRISESSSDSGKDEQERQTKVIVSIEHNEKTTTMEQFYKILKSSGWINLNPGSQLDFPKK